MTANFNELTRKVNEAEAEIKASMSKTREALRALVREAQDKAEQQADEIKADTDSGMKSVNDKWHAHIAQLHQRNAEKKAERDIRKAASKADDAEAYAEEAIDFAIAAIQEAEYAVLDAALARTDADALAG